MPRDSCIAWFHFRMGASVRWAAHPTTRYTICQRRFTQRDGLAPIVEYLLWVPAQPEAGSHWAYEPDLLAWDNGAALPS